MGNSDSLSDMPELREVLKFTTIGVNRILETLPTVTYFMAVDETVLKDEHEKINRASREGTVVILYPSALTGKTAPNMDCDYLEMDWMSPDADVAAKEGPMCIPAGGNTGFYAAQLAYRVGAKTIAMAGIDLWWPPGRRSHACGHGKDLGCKLGPVDEKIAAFAAMSRRYKEFGVTLTSVSPWRTRLRKAVGYTPMSEVLNRAKADYSVAMRQEVSDGQEEAQED